MTARLDDAVHQGAAYTPTCLGHRPRCAERAAEIFERFPREERLNSLRPHIVPDSWADSKRRAARTTQLGSSHVTVTDGRRSPPIG